jgi:hypothetical protein
MRFTYLPLQTSPFEYSVFYRLLLTFSPEPFNPALNRSIVPSFPPSSGLSEQLDPAASNDMSGLLERSLGHPTRALLIHPVRMVQRGTDSWTGSDSRTAQACCTCGSVFADSFWVQSHRAARGGPGRWFDCTTTRTSSYLLSASNSPHTSLPSVSGHLPWIPTTYLKD